VPLSETFALRALASRVDSAGFVDYPNVYLLNEQGNPLFSGDILTAGTTTRRVKDANWFESDSYRVSALWQPNERWSLLLTHADQSDDVGGRQAQTEGNNGFGVPYAENELGAIMLEPSSRDVDLTSLELEVDLGFATFTSSTSTYNHDGQGISDNTGWYTNAFFYPLYYAGSPRPMESAHRTYYDEAFVQELRLVSNSDDSKIDWVVGAFYMEQEFGNTQDSFSHGWAAWALADAQATGRLLFIDPASGNYIRDGFQMLVDDNFHYDRNEVFTDRAVFGELTYHFSDALKATVGLRYFDNDFDSDVVLDLPPISLLGFNSDVKRSVSDDDVLGKLNIAYDISDRMMTYFTVSEGYRRGGTNGIPTEGIYRDDPGWLVYEKDTAVNYEVGVKGNTDRFTYTAAVYYLDWKNPQLNTGSNAGFFVVANADTAKTQGVELEVQGNLTDNLYLSLGYAYTDAKLTSDAIFPGNTEPTIFDGAQLPGSAKNTANLALSYTQPLASGNKRVVYYLNGYYQDKTRLSTAETGIFNHTFDGFSIFDGSVSLVSDNWTLALYAKNLTDEDGAVGLYPEAWMGTNPSDSFFGNDARTIIAYPRTYGVSFSYSF
jgi:outer membrane receptor protein involved in Fe transport